MTSPGDAAELFGACGITSGKSYSRNLLYPRCRAAAEIITTPPTITATSRIAV
jgi:hypothetical protein